MKTKCEEKVIRRGSWESKVVGYWYKIESKEISSSSNVASKSSYN